MPLEKHQLVVADVDRAEGDRLDALLDEALDGTFPASDPVAIMVRKRSPENLPPQKRPRTFHNSSAGAGAMSIQLQQMHPAMVHVPITLLPLAVGADLLGYLIDKKSLHSFGKAAIVAAAVGAAAAAVTGLIAGEEVNVEGESRDMLMTHRNLNFIATVVAGCMAFQRSQRRKPGAVYLGVGLAGAGIVAYTAYLGGKLVYDTGVGVGPAHGVYRQDAPVLGAGEPGEFFKTAATDLVHGVQHMVAELGQGKFVPALTSKGKAGS